MTSPIAPVLSSLAAEWLARAAQFRAYGAEGQALSLEHAARELEAAIAAAEHELLTLEQARAESGYSDRQLRQLLATGAIPNVGRKGAPRVRRADLPRKARKATLRAYDVTSDALTLMTPRRVAQSRGGTA